MPTALVPAIFFQIHGTLKRNFYEIELEFTYETISLQKSPKILDPLTTFFCGYDPPHYVPKPSKMSMHGIQAMEINIFLVIYLHTDHAPFFYESS
jgi:hypothetical protein